MKNLRYLFDDENMPYDYTDLYSVLSYAKELQGKCVNDIIGSKIKTLHYGGKGGFGQFLEEAYFGISNDSASSPDFEHINTELKTVPLKHIYVRNKPKIVPKERLVLGMIDYNKIINETFNSSHLIKKCQILLLIFYMHNSKLDNRYKKINLVDLWKFLEEDREQIEEDWNFIVNKIRYGQAHELSEGDTLFLGACTKGSTAKKSLREQPNSDIKAKSRAFCFKTSYVKYIFNTLNEKKEGKNKKINNLPTNIILKQAPPPPNNSLRIDNKVNNIFSPYFGFTEEQLTSTFNLKYKDGCKSRRSIMAKAILGGTTNKYHILRDSNIRMKTIKIEYSGALKESISFEVIDYNEIAQQDFEDSDFYHSLTCKFLFVIFKTTEDGTVYLDRVKLWNMSENDIYEAKEVWLKFKSQILNFNYNNKLFPKSKNHRIAHVRPHAKSSKDLVKANDGSFQKKYSFWLNAKYIKNIIK